MKAPNRITGCVSNAREHFENVLPTLRNYNSNSLFQKIFLGIILNKYTMLNMKFVKKISHAL